jgi:hypothetical protein
MVGVRQGGAAFGNRLLFATLHGCADTATVLCLNDNRFALTSRYLTAKGEEGPGRARPLANDSGTFWFFGPDNRELIAKMLDGCGVNGHYWMFAAGLTNVGVELQAYDLHIGKTRSYTNPVGRTYAPVLDTEAFACSADEIAAASERSSAVSANPKAGATVVSKNFPDGTACGGAAEDLCLENDRFRVEVDYTDFAGQTSAAFGGNLTSDTGALFFFDRSNVEMLIKILDGCAINDRFWVFAAGLTNLGVTLEVTDTVTGQSARYDNPVRTPFRAITDTTTFAGCS